jgi:hypothetical protein
MRHLIVVDGFNVLHAGVLRGRDRAGWWRPEARAKLLAALAPLAEGPAEVRVVFDARGEGGERDTRRSPGATNDAGATEAAGIVVLLAAHADDRIVEEVLREAPRRPVTAVTSDRELARRVRAAGGDVVGAGAFLARLAPGGPG